MRAETSSRVSTSLPRAARWRSIDISGTSPEPPPTSSSGPPSSTRQEKCAPIGPRSSISSPCLQHAGQVRRDLAVVDPLDGQREPPVLGARGDRVGALRLVAVGAVSRTSTCWPATWPGQPGTSSTIVTACGRLLDQPRRPWRSRHVIRAAGRAARSRRGALLRRCRPRHLGQPRRAASRAARPGRTRSCARRRRATTTPVAATPGEPGDARAASTSSAASDA